VLPHWLGGILWNLLGIAALLWAMRQFVREVLPGHWPPWREAMLVALVLVGTLRGSWSAQSNALVIAMAMLAAVAVKKERWWAASVLLAAPVFIKLWPMALALLLMACWPRQLVGRFCVVLAAGLLVPFLTRPPGAVYQQYYEYYFWLTGPLSLDRWGGYRDAVTIFEQMGLHLGRYGYPVLQAEAAMLALAWCLWQRQQLGSERRLLTSILAVWPAWQLLFGPGSERLTYGIIAVAAAWALLVSFAEKRLRLLAGAAWLLLSLFSMGAFERAVQPVLPCAPALLPLGVLLFVSWLVIHETAPATAATACQPAAALLPAPFLVRIQAKPAGRLEAKSQAADGS